MPSFEHTFKLSTFKDTSFSECKVTLDASGETTYEIAMLAYDIVHGLFQYRIELHIPASNHDIARLTVTHTGLYLLGLQLERAVSIASTSTLITSPLTHRANIHSPPPPLTPETPTPMQSHSQFLQNLGHLALGTSSATSRGFLSAFAMGAQGRRAVWVERKRGGVAREVQVWDDSRTTPPSSPEWIFHYGAECREMERDVVHTNPSYDLKGVSRMIGRGVDFDERLCRGCDMLHLLGIGRDYRFRQSTGECLHSASLKVDSGEVHEIGRVN